MGIYIVHWIDGADSIREYCYQKNYEKERILFEAALMYTSFPLELFWSFYSLPPNKTPLPVLSLDEHMNMILGGPGVNNISLDGDPVYFNDIDVVGMLQEHVASLEKIAAFMNLSVALPTLNISRSYGRTIELDVDKNLFIRSPAGEALRIKASSISVNGTDIYWELLSNDSEIKNLTSLLSNYTSFHP